MLAIAGALVFLVTVGIKPPAVETIIEALPQGVGIALKKISYTETRSGEKLWTLSADSVDHASGQQQTYLENVRVVFYSQGEFGDVTLTSDKGYWFRQQGRIDLEGNVETHSASGYAFYSQKLTYLNEQGLIQTDLPVKVVGRGMEITGTGMRMDTNTHHVYLLSRVQGTLNDL